MTELETVEAQINTAQQRHAELTAAWKHQCQQGVFGAAESTEEALDVVERELDRYLVRREYLQTNPQPVEE